VTSIASDAERLQLMRTDDAKVGARIAGIRHATLNGIKGSGGGYMPEQMRKAIMLLRSMTLSYHESIVIEDIVKILQEKCADGYFRDRGQND
jgi:hypothetical protein